MENKPDCFGAFDRDLTHCVQCPVSVECLAAQKSVDSKQRPPPAAPSNGCGDFGHFSEESLRCVNCRGTRELCRQRTDERIAAHSEKLGEQAAQRAAEREAWLAQMPRRQKEFVLRQEAARQFYGKELSGCTIEERMLLPPCCGDSGYGSWEFCEVCQLAADCKSRGTGFQRWYRNRSIAEAPF